MSAIQLITEACLHRVTRHGPWLAPSSIPSPSFVWILVPFLDPHIYYRICIIDLRNMMLPRSAKLSSSSRLICTRLYVRTLRTQPRDTIPESSTHDLPHYPPGIGLATPREVFLEPGQPLLVMCKTLMMMIACRISQSICYWPGKREESFICCVCTLSSRP